MEKDRLEFLDVLKGISIVLVVVGHVEFFILGTKSVIYTMLANSHMPIFFFISGFFFFKKERKVNPLKLSMQKFRMLMVPFLVVGSLYVWYIGADWNRLFFTNMKLGYWFTFVLFEVMLFTILLEFIQKRVFRFQRLWFDLLYYFGASLILDLIRKFVILPVDVSQFIDLQQLPFYLRIFVLGYLVRKYELSNWLEKSWLFAVALVLYLASVVCMRLQVAHIAIIYLIGITPIVVGWYLCRNNIFGKATSIFSCLGRNSLEIYLIHYFFIFSFKDLGLWLNDMGNPFVLQLGIDLALAMGLILLSLGVSQIVKQNNVLQLLIFGKK